MGRPLKNMEENQYFNYDNPEYNKWMDASVMEPYDSNVFSRWFNPQEAEASEFQRENLIMDKSNQFNEYMFNKANEWNSAGAQMERARNAGINPVLAAAGIAGSGASATPMQSSGAGVGMHTGGENPFNTANSIFDMLQKGSGTAETLSKLFGFGKETKANLKIADETAKKLSGETDLNLWERKKIERTFDDFCREAEANADAAQKHIEELQELIDNYKADTELKRKQKELTEEQTDTQKEITKQEELKKWEQQFKKKLRDMFGVQVNDSDLGMLTQLLLNGKGEQVIKALTDMLGSVTKGIKEEIGDKIANTIIGEKKIKNIKRGQTFQKAYREYKKNGGKMGALQFYNYIKKHGATGEW